MESPETIREMFLLHPYIGTVRIPFSSSNTLAIVLGHFFGIVLASICVHMLLSLIVPCAVGES